MIELLIAVAWITAMCLASICICLGVIFVFVMVASVVFGTIHLLTQPLLRKLSKPVY